MGTNASFFIHNLVGKDISKAMQLYNEGAQLGIAHCQHFLGRYYQNDENDFLFDQHDQIHVQTNINQAIEFYRLAARQGMSDAQQMYLNKILKFPRLFHLPFLLHTSKPQTRTSKSIK